MRALLSRLLFVFVLFPFAPTVFAHDVTITGAQNFSSLDGSSSDHDGVTNGVFTVSDGNLIVNGVVNCNDDGAGNNSACAMAFNVTGNMTINVGGALYAENRKGSGAGGAITMTAGGNLAMNGNAIVSSASRTSGGANGGAITANVGGNVTLAAGTTIDAGSASATGGNVRITAVAVTANGNLLSGPSRTLLATRRTGAILGGSGDRKQRGGEIRIRGIGFLEPSVTVGDAAVIASQGRKNGAGPVMIEGCGVIVKGLVAALSEGTSAARVAILSGKAILVDSRELGVAAATLGRLGQLRADSLDGTALNNRIDIFAVGSVDVLGPAPAASSLYAASSNPLRNAGDDVDDDDGDDDDDDGDDDDDDGVVDTGGTISVISLSSAVNGAGRAFIAGVNQKDSRGGRIDVAARMNVNLDSAVLSATGSITRPRAPSKGGVLTIRSYSGNVSWRNGTGDVRPLGSQTNLPPADQGRIVLTACTTIDTTGSTFPANGVATSVHPVVQTGVCAPAAPSLPTGSPALIICNTPPVANDVTATTTEDTTVTITLTGSDADGHSLTFTVVSGPLHGSLGPIVPTGPTSATVNYTPASNYNGPDSFVYRANDGNGGTDDATVSITVGPVNDPPSFQIGPTDIVLEDSGPRTYANWVTAISPGPSDESAQTVIFTVTNDNNALFSVQPSVAPNGTLTYTPAPNANGAATITVVAQDNGGTANGGNDTSVAQTSNINVTPVNDEPSFVRGADQTVNEDAGAQTVSGWATAISAGPNESSQTVAFVTSNNNNALFSAQPSVAPNGTLTFTPAANANGSAVVTVHLSDDGGIANGGDDTSPSQTFTITVNAVNDAPSFTGGGNVTVLEDSGAYSATWATGISAGPADESVQTVAFNTSNDNNTLFSAQPSVSASGVLTFTVTANAYGSATVTVSLSDNGGIANGGVDTSAPQTFVLNVTPVNDEPSFTTGGNVTVNEDAGAYSATWATGISAGPNESSQNVTFVTTNDNNALFAIQPSVSSGGVLTFTSAADAFGSATVTIYLTDDGGTANGGDDTSPSQTFTITVSSVNDAPTFTSGGNVTVNEDSGAYSATWATVISAGPANESSQTVSFVANNDNNALFSVQPSVSSSGVLSFTLAADANGSATVTIYAQDDGGTANGGVDVSASQTFTITVGDVNDAPSFTPGANQTSSEDAGAQTVLNWATSISVGPANESSQTVTFVATNDNNALFSSQPSISASGTLTYTAAPNANGSAIVMVYAQDNGGTANGGDDTSATYTFTITVVAVNDAPSFAGGGDVTVLEDSGSYSAAWATAISAGPPDESGQTLTFNVLSNSNPSFFASGPSISASGVLSFTAVANASGSATITINLQDNGGIANGGVDSSTSYTFTINVTPVNDAPSFTPGGDVTVNEDSGPYAAGWATSISAGPNESGQTVAFLVSNNNNALFLAQPSISATGILTFTSAPNAFGSAIVTVALQDNGGTATGGVDTSAPVQFTIAVNAVNDAPTAVTDSWDTLGNTELRVDLVGGLTPKVVDTTPSGNGVRDNDSDPEGDPSVVSGIVGCADPTAPFDCTLGDGSIVSMLANGSFTYTPGPGNTSGTFQYTVTDIPAFGTPVSSTGTVNITILDMIWYVNGSAGAGGNGTSIAPFNSFASLNGPGGAGDVDSPNATIFVHDSNVIGGIGLEANQKLWGEGVGLITSNNLNGNGSPQVLVAPGVRARIFGGSGNAVSVTSVTGVDIAGLDLNSTGANGVDVTSNFLGPATSASIHDNVVTGAALEGIDVNASSASGATVTVNNTSITSSGNGLDVNSVGPAVISYTNGTITSTGGNGIRFDGTASGNLTIAGLANVTIGGNTTGIGINITTAKFDAIPGGTFDTVTAGAIAVGTSGNPVGNAGVVMTNVSGDIAISSLNAFGGTSGVAIAGSGLYTGSSGVRVTNGAGSISAPAGTGLSVTNATIGAANLNFTSISATGGTHGVVLNNTGTSGGLSVTGTGAANSGGTIHNVPTGISLTSTNGTALAYMDLRDFTDFAIRGASTSNFSMTNTTIAGTNGDNAVADEGSVYFTGLTGTATISNSSISGGFENNFTVINSSGTLDRIMFNNVTIGPNSTLAGNDGVFLAAQNSAVLNATVQNSFFTSARGDLFQLNLLGASSSDLVFIGNALSNNHPAIVSGGGGVTISGGDNTTVGGVTLTYDISNNTFRDANGHAVLVVKATDPGSFIGTFNGNSIGVAALADSGSLAGSGLKVQNAGKGTVAAVITNNTIRQYNNFGIELVTGGGATPQPGNLFSTITGNTVANPGTGGLPMNGIHLNGGTIPGDTYQICLKIGGAGAQANAITGSGANGGTDFRLRQRQSTTVRLPGYSGAATNTAAVVAFVQSNNGVTPTGIVNVSSPPGGGFVGTGSSCP